MRSKWQTLKTTIPAASKGALRGFAPSGAGLLEYSFRASPSGIYDSGYLSHQQVGEYFGKGNKLIRLVVGGKSIRSSLV
jgi:hypothetical protein